MELGDGDGGRKGTPSRDSSLTNRGAEMMSILKKWLGTVEFLYQAGLDISKGEWKYQTFLDGKKRDRGCQHICGGDWPKGPSVADATPQKHRSPPSEKRGPWRERRGVQMADQIEIYLHLLAATHHPDQSWKGELLSYDAYCDQKYKGEETGRGQARGKVMLCH